MSRDGVEHSIKIEALMALLAKLPSNWTARVNQVDNLSLLNEHGQYCGILDMAFWELDLFSEEEVASWDRVDRIDNSIV